MKETYKVVALILLGANLVLPYVIFSFAYLRPMAEIRENRENLKKVQENNVKIAAFLAGPQVVEKFNESISRQIVRLQKLMPPKIEMITMQKIFSQIAKEVDAAIISLKPLSENIPFEIENLPKTASAAEKTAKKEDTGFKTALMQIKLKGSYQDITKFISRVEEAKNAVFLVDSLQLSAVCDVDQAFIEADIIIKIFYTQ